ncbi:MAG TPA: hypothetical protein VEL68_15035 [Thermodesulfobacteriota bacterium]|nr:hypothetical protein [Thermodesulfobacteriota bacterium]
MNNNLKWVMMSFVSIWALTFLWSGTPVSAQMSGLDGKVFAGELGKKGEKTGDKDDLIFKDGKFVSTACEKYGFGAAPYLVATGEGNTTFEASADGGKDGTMKWKGAIKGDSLTATVVWSKPGQPEQEFWYRGKMKK